jgi:hypothetical protein
MHVAVPALLGEPRIYFLEVPTLRLTPRLGGSGKTWRRQVDRRDFFGVPARKVSRYSRAEVVAVGYVALKT